MLQKNDPLHFLDTPYIIATFHKVDLGTAFYWIFLKHEVRHGRMGGPTDGAKREVLS